MTKRIVLTANTSWYLYNFRQGSIVALTNAGYSVYTVAPDNKYADKLSALGASHHIVYMDIHSKNPIKDLRTTFSYIKCYKRINPEIILNFTPKPDIYSTLAAGWLKKPVINNISGLGNMFVSKGLLNKIVTLLYKISQRFAKHVFCQNSEDMEMFTQKRIVKPEKLSQLPGSGVDINKLNFTELNTGVDKFVLVARMIKEKGIELFADAAKKIKQIYPNVEFALVGDIEKNNHAGISLKCILEWKDYVEYLGRTDNIEQIIKQYTAVVLPSYYREGTPRSLLEAGALGRPIITTDSAGCRDTIINGVSGFLCLPKDSDSLTEAILKFIRLSHQEKQEMGRASRAYIEQNFDEKIVINKYLEKIREINPS